MSAITGGELFQYSLYVGINLQDILYGKFGNTCVVHASGLTWSFTRRCPAGAIFQDHAQLAESLEGAHEIRCVLYSLQQCDAGVVHDLGDHTGDNRPKDVVAECKFSGWRR